MPSKINKTLADIAKLVDGEVIGNPKLKITGLSGIKEAKPGDLSFVANLKYFPLAAQTKATALLVPRNFDGKAVAVIRTENPSLAFAKIASMVIKADAYKLKGIHKTAVIAKTAKLGKNVAVGAHAVIEAGVNIAEGSTISPGCFIGHETTLGKECLVYPNVTIRERVIIGNNVIIHSGSVVGSDGFGFEKVGDVHTKIPQIGTVVVEDDVEIGANVTIDRARFDRTIIGRGTKIDNLVQIAHNVIIGENCIIVAQTGIAGSVEIKKGAILAGQSGVAGHLVIGEGVIVAAQSGVTKSIPANTMVSGFPAKPHAEAKKVNAAFQNLPRFVETIKELKLRVETLEKELKLKKV